MGVDQLSIPLRRYRKIVLPVLRQSRLFRLCVSLLTAQDWLVQWLHESPLLHRRDVLREPVDIDPLDDPVVVHEVDACLHYVVMDTWRCLYLSPLLLHLALTEVGKLNSSCETLSCGTWDEALVCRTIVNTNASDKHLGVGIRLLRVLVAASLSMLLLHRIEAHLHSKRCLFVTLKIV